MPQNIAPQRWREVYSDGIEWQVFRVCPICKGSGIYPPYDPHAYLTDPPEGRCGGCHRGIVVERFRSTAELKRYVNGLPDESAERG